MIQVEAMKEAVQLLQDEGFTRQDAIELLKVQAISTPVRCWMRESDA